MEEQVITALQDLGFTPAEAKKQLTELNELIIQSFGAELVELYPDIKWNEGSAVEELANLPEREALKALFDKHSAMILFDYFESITTSATDEQKNAFFSKISSITSQKS